MGQLAYFKIPKYVQFVTDLAMTVTGRVPKFRMKETV